MRKFLSITLLFLTSFPLVAPLFALDAATASNLPACCRRNGAHHCAMSSDQLAALAHGDHFTVIRSKCPMFPAATAAAHHEPVSFHSASLIYAGVLSHPAQFHQVEAWARVALAGARQKRGPPAVRLS